MLYGPQGIFGGLTPSQRDAHERRRQAAERLAKAARSQESAGAPASGEKKTADDTPEMDAFFKSAWRLLDASTAIAEKPPIGSWPVRKIQECVCAYYQITMEDLTSPGRTQDLARPRQVAMYLSRILTGRSLPEIGRRFGARRHTTVLHAVRQISARLQHDGRLARDIDAITASLRASIAPEALTRPFTTHHRRIQVSATGKKRKRTSPSSTAAEGPNEFRLRQARGAFEVGDDQQGGRIYTMTDTPLARAHARGILNDAQYRALAKFKHHWTCAGLEPSFGSADLDRVFGSDVAGYSGMAKTEAQVFHRQRYRQAVATVGLITSRVIEAVVCEEKKLEEAGSAILGWKHPLQARAAAAEKLRDGGDRLAKEWGL